MVKNKDEEDNELNGFDINYWAVQLIFDNNYKRFLTKEGLILKEIVANQGVCKGQRKTARELNISCSKMSILLKKLEDDGFVLRDSIDGRKKYFFISTRYKVQAKRFITNIKNYVMRTDD